MQPKFKAWLAEFIGTYALVYVGGAAIVYFTGATDEPLLGIAIAHGVVITVFVAALAIQSGAHYNPAVTLAALLTRKIDPVNAAGYFLSQCVAGFAAVACLMLSFDHDALREVAMGAPQVADGVDAWPALVAEVISTFFLVFVIFAAGMDKRSTVVAPIYIGTAVAVGIFAVGHVSGAAMNPARHLGPAILAGPDAWDHFWIYWVGPAIGGVAAGVSYHWTFEERARHPADHADDKPTELI
jgi:aquaporin Z